MRQRKALVRNLKLLPGGQVVRRLTLDEEIEGSNPSRAAKKRDLF